MTGWGHRVVKVMPSLTATYVYDGFGQMAAEYYSGGTLPVPPCSTRYLTYDCLGSVRMVTDSQANVVARHDFAPFGQEISGTGGRGAAWGLTSDVDAKFTGKERDSESALDYFGARYYGSALGRFTSPDWSSEPVAVPYANLEDPQTLNLYTYVRNNPLSKTDADGHCDVDVGGGKTEHHWGWCIWHDLGFYQTQPEQQAQADEQRRDIAAHSLTLASGQKLDKDYLSRLSNSQVSTLAGQLANQEDDEQWDRLTQLLGALPLGPFQGPLTKDQARFAQKNNLNQDSQTSRDVLQNLDSSVEEFVGKYRRAGIKNELPGDALKKSVREAIQSGDSTVRKLLVDKRFAK